MIEITDFLLQRQRLVQSVMSKMNYTCDNENCRFKPQNKNTLIKKNLRQISVSLTALESMILGANFEKPKEKQVKKPVKQNYHYKKQKKHKSERKINNSLHEGSLMKSIIYDSENPEAQVRKGSHLNYETLYNRQENKIQKTRAVSVQGKSKIRGIIQRDRTRLKE